MNFEFPEELTEVQKLARDFSEKEIAPSAAKDDREQMLSAIARLTDEAGSG
jgi:alkylation response protein AidB-like acyl-CoA dehydrogenase